MKFMPSHNNKQIVTALEQKYDCQMTQTVKMIVRDRIISLATEVVVSAKLMDGGDGGDGVDGGDGGDGVVVGGGGGDTKRDVDEFISSQIKAEGQRIIHDYRNDIIPTAPTTIATIALYATATKYETCNSNSNNSNSNIVLSMIEAEARRIVEENQEELLLLDVIKNVNSLQEIGWHRYYCKEEKTVMYYPAVVVLPKKSEWQQEFTRKIQYIGV